MTRLEFDTRAEAEDYLRDQPGLVTHNPASGMFYYENGDSILAVLDAASDLGAVSHMVPGFFDTDTMIRTFATDPGVDIDPNDDPYIVVIDPYTLEIGEHRQMSEIKSLEL